MTGLEALQIIKDNLNYFRAYALDCEEDRLGNILQNEFDLIEKELKAFDLIVNKSVVIFKLKSTQFLNIDEYNKNLSPKQQLTDDERTIILETLKKVLTNENKSNN